MKPAIQHRMQPCRTTGTSYCLFNHGRPLHTKTANDFLSFICTLHSTCTFFLRKPNIWPSSYQANNLVINPPPSASSCVPKIVDPTNHWLNEKAKAKFCSNASDPSSFDIISSLKNSQHIQLLPFIVEHLGGIGHFAHHFLHGPSINPLCPPSPNWKPSQLPHSAAYTAYQHTSGPASIQGLLPAAETSWKQKHPPNHYFGTSYHTSFSSHWANQTLGFNLTHTLTTYLHCGFDNTQSTTLLNTASSPSCCIFHSFLEHCHYPMFESPYTSTPQLSTDTTCG